MKKKVALYVCSLMQSTTALALVWIIVLQTHNSWMILSHRGRRDAEFNMTPMLAVLSANICQSVNFNFADTIRSYCTATFPNAINHPSMAFALFTGRKSKECIEWILKEDVQSPKYDRAVSEDNM